MPNSCTEARFPFPSRPSPLVRLQTSAARSRFLHLSSDSAEEGPSTLPRTGTNYLIVIMTTTTTTAAAATPSVRVAVLFLHLSHFLLVQTISMSELKRDPRVKLFDLNKRRQPSVTHWHIWRNVFQLVALKKCAKLTGTLLRT